MPTERRIEAVAAEVTEKYERLGYDVEEFVGPAERPDAEEFYLYLSSGGSSLYLTFYTDFDAVGVAYPYTVTRAVGRKLTETQREHVVDATDSDEAEPTPESVGRLVLEQTDSDTVHELRFRLADHAGSPLVGVEVDTTDNGAPVRFRSHVGLLPYADSFDLQTLDTRTDMVLTAGSNGNRFVRDALTVDTDGDPSEYGVELRF